MTTMFRLQFFACIIALLPCLHSNVLVQLSIYLYPDVVWNNWKILAATGLSLGTLRGDMLLVKMIRWKTLILDCYYLCETWSYIQNFFFWISEAILRTWLWVWNFQFIGKKAAYALSQGLKVIACIGELLQEREAGKTFDVCFQQMKAFAGKFSCWCSLSHGMYCRFVVLLWKENLLTLL